MKRIDYKQIEEAVYETELDNGLKLIVIPKRGFQKTYVTLTTKYGSVHNAFKPYGKNEIEQMPEGIAHFLEHKMFESEEGDMFNAFSMLGASANAFTSYDRTSYLFTAVDHVEDNIDLLLKMVQRPYFTTESVEKEIGIIAEEIRMYQDQPNYRLYYQTLNGMYHRHPVKEDIAGTVDSIQEITAEKLYACYHTFYRPENMVMLIVGNVAPDAVAAFVEQHQYAEPMPRYIAELDVVDEPRHVRENKVSQTGDVTTPKLMLGFKSKLHEESTHTIQHELEMMFVLDMLFGEHTDFYQELQQDGLIDDSFGYSFNLEQTFSHALIAGTTKDPRELSRRLIERMQTTEWDEAVFKRLVKQTIGEYISSLNSPEYIANQFTRYYFNGAMLFDVLPVLEGMTLDSALETFKAAIDIHHVTESLMLPYA